MMPYLSEPKHGWSSLTLENFYAPLSYIDDIPLMILDFVLQYKQTHNAVAAFDCEGYEFVLVCSGLSIYVILEKGRTTLHTFDTNARNFVNGLLSEIEDHIHWWQEFTPDADNPAAVRDMRKEILDRIKKIEDLKKK